jgi:hypothetical protein
MDIEKLQKIVKYSTYAFIAWVLSWVFFFVTLPVMVIIFGKVRGAAINYAISWVTLPIIILVLEYVNKKDDTPR